MFNLFSATGTSNSTSPFIEKYFGQLFTVCRERLLLVGSFIDDHDSGHIFLNENNEKIYIPTNVILRHYPFYPNNEILLSSFQNEFNQFEFVNVDNCGKFFFLSFVSSESDINEILEHCKLFEPFKKDGCLFEDHRSKI